MNRLLSVFILTIIVFTSSAAQSLRFPAPFSDHMVLQRNRPLALPGYARPGNKVQLSFNGNTYTALADSRGHFTFCLPAMPEGGPYSLTYSCGEEIRTFNDVYLGEVWLCSGQSNMQFALEDCSTAAEDLAAADTLSQIHIYNMCSAFIPYREIWDEERIATVDRGAYIQTGTWQVSSAENVRRFSAIGFHTGRILAEKLGCHIGLIANALDGCTTEGWIDRETLQREVPEILEGDWTENPDIMSWSRRRARYNLQQTDIRKHRHPYEPTYLYDAAIRPLEAYPLRGVLWYQGESNAELVAMHERLFATLQHSWRTTWNDPQLPFHFVQIASLSKRPTWPAFRDSQRRLAERLPQTFMTVSHDMGEADNIHPTRKRIIGERLAASVLHHTYGMDRIIPGGPLPRRAVLEQGVVRIDFTQADGLHWGKESGKADFEFVGSDGNTFTCPNVTLHHNGVRLQIPQGVSSPRKVRFAYRDDSTAQLLNAAGMPCSTFEMAIEPQRILQGAP